ncbi:MAG: alpha/beta hydrolase family protein [Terriglobales bacterium]
MRKALPLLALLTLAAAAQTVQQVRLTTDDVQVDGIVYRAAKPRSTALLLVHGFGGNFYGGYFPALSQAAAAQGYTALALNMRDHDLGPKTSDFTDNKYDIAAGVKYLRDQGATRVALLGQSMGTNRVLYYQAATGDPHIAATVLVSGPGNLFEWNVWQFGREKAQATVDQALKLKSSGRKKEELMLVDLGPLGKALYTPRYLLSLRGPEARSDPYENLAKVKNPVLIIQGKADKLIAPDIAERLKKAATSAGRVDVLFVEGATHQFRGEETELSDRILRWLEEVTP